MSSKLHFRHTVTVTAMMELSEDELEALSALACYGTDAFLRTFYKEMGEAYLRPHEAGLRSLFDRASAEVSFALGDVKKAREALA